MPNFAVFPTDIPSLLLVLVWLGLMGSVRHSGYGIALLSLGATAIHEACHLVFGLILNAKPVSFSLWPKRQGKHWVLGSVGFSNLNIWNSPFVAFAPLAMLPLGWLVFQLWMRPAFRSGAYFSWLLAGYVVACCGFACLPSTTDIKLGALSAAMYCAIAFGLWRAIF
jgi:hypothetical protein